MTRPFTNLSKRVTNPTDTAHRVSESVTEGNADLSERLSFQLGKMGRDLGKDDLTASLEWAGYDGTIPDDVEEMVGEAYRYFVHSGRQRDNFMGDEEFKQRAMTFIANKDAIMTDSIDDTLSLREYYKVPGDTDNMPYIEYEAPEDCKAAYDLANEHQIKCCRDLDKLFFINEDYYEAFVSVIEANPEFAYLLGDATDALPQLQQEEEKMTFENDGDDLAVVLHTQVFENIGTDARPQWATRTGRATLVQSGIQSFGEARSIAAQVSAGIIPVQLGEGENVLGIDIMSSAEYRQFHEAAPADETVEEETTDAVFFQQQVMEMQRAAGIKTGEVSFDGTPSVHTFRERLAKLEKPVLESAFEARLDDMPRVIKTLGRTLIANPTSDALRVAKAVAKKMFGNTDVDAMVDYLEVSYDMDLEDYAHEVRTNGISESRSVNEETASMKRGRDDFAAGMSMSDVPSEYPVGSAPAGDWIVGWRFAQRDEKANQWKAGRNQH